MEYKDFISKLYIKGVGITKAEFTKKLFMRSVKDTSVITDKRNSVSVYKGYNRGNSINEIAYDVIHNLNQSGTESCIEEYLNNMQDKEFENVQTISGKFKEQIPDITRENICEKIASFFVGEVLKPAAKEYKKTISSSEPSAFEEITSPVQKAENTEISVDNHSVGNSVKITNISTNEYNILRPTIIKRHAEKIEEIVSNIEALIEPLIYDNASDMEEDFFKSNYSRFRKLNGNLCGYASMYPFIKSLQELPALFLEKTDFCLSEASSQRLVDYALLLLAIRKEITGLDEE